MLMCINCKSVFDEDNVHFAKELLGECFGFPVYDTYSVCPDCGSDLVDTAIQCEFCGEYILECNAVLSYDNEYLCDKCSFKCDNCSECYNINTTEKHIVDDRTYCDYCYKEISR